MDGKGKQYTFKKQENCFTKNQTEFKAKCG
jgi:hypothetical protein